MNKVSIASLVLRIGFGIYMIFGHGLSKFMKLVNGDMKFASVMGMPESVSLVLAVLTEFVLPILVVIGFKTRWAAIPPALTMFVAAFVIHGGDAWFAANANGGGSKEMAILFMLGFTAIAILDSGKYSLDYWLKKGKK